MHKAVSNKKVNKTKRTTPTKTTTTTTTTTKQQRISTIPKRTKPSKQRPAQQQSHFQHQRKAKFSTLQEQQQQLDKEGAEIDQILADIPDRAKEVNIPLNEAFPVELPSIASAATLNTTPRLTRLKNGIRVITQDSDKPIVYVHTRINAGSMYEDLEETELGTGDVTARLLNEYAASLLLEHPASTNFIADSNRESIDLRASTTGSITLLVQLMAQLVTTNDWARENALDPVRSLYLKHLIPNYITTASERFEDDIHYNVFSEHGLSNPTTPTTECILSLDVDKVKAFQKKMFTADRITIAAVGVDHDDFVKVCEQLFGQIDSSDHVLDVEKIENAEFPQRNNHLLLPTMDGDEIDPQEQRQHVALSWIGPELSSLFLVPMTVLSTAIGRSSSFSSGGPGKGMYARATTHLLGPRPWIDEISSFYLPYPTTSVFGVMGVVDPSHTNNFISEIMDELQQIGHSLTDEDVERAKNQLKRQILAHHEMGEIRCSELARNAALHHAWKSDEQLASIDKVTTAQVQQSAQLLFDPESVIITTLGDPRNVARQYWTRLPDDPKEGPYTQEELDDILATIESDNQSSQKKDGGVISSIKNLFSFGNK